MTGVYIQMVYAISDVHGLYDKYIKMLDKIKFNDSDTLYVLGDAIDRGPGPLKVLFDMHKRVNVIPLMGNHEYIALDIFRKIRPYTAEQYVIRVDRDYRFHL